MGDTQKMQKTRHPGVYRLPDGRFWIRWTIQTDGKRKDREEALAPSLTIEEAVRTRANRIEADRSPSVSLQPEKPPPPLLGEYASAWYARKEPGMKLRSKEFYKQVLNDWILPFFGHIAVDKLRRSHLEQWVAYMETWACRRKRAREPQPYEPIWWVPVSRASLQSWWSKVKEIMRDCYAEYAAEYDLKDWTERVKGPKAYSRPRVHEQQTLVFSELRAVMWMLSRQWRLEYLTEALSGQRPGELYELQWDLDVQLDRDQIEVKRSHAKGEVGTTKTNRIKVLPLGPTLKQLLSEHREAQKRAGGPALETNLVFPASKKGNTNWRRRASSLRNALERAGRAAGLSIRVTPQVMRRTFNTLMKDGGLSDQAIQDLMGHTSTDMTDRYYQSRMEVKAPAIQAHEASLGIVSLDDPN